MTSPAVPPITRAHHVSEAAYGLLAAMAVLGIDAAVMWVWWWGGQAPDSSSRTWLAGIVIATLMVVGLAAMVRHRAARRAAVLALALALVADAIVVGYELAGLPIL